MPAGNLGPYELNRVHLGRSPECLKAIPDGTVHTCITSPPYWGLRGLDNPPYLGIIGG
jgi:DNA modification methylase